MKEGRGRYRKGSVSYRDVDSDLNLDLFALITITTDYNHDRLQSLEVVSSTALAVHLYTSGINRTSSTAWSNQTARLAKLLLL
jgi:hypothetical protein